MRRDEEGRERKKDFRAKTGIAQTWLFGACRDSYLSISLNLHSTTLGQGNKIGLGIMIIAILKSPNQLRKC
jgi:hypothetical protein